MLLVLLLALSLLIAISLGEQVIIWSALALPLVATYPFMKRITWWPQLFLGFTFNWGALLGWVAVRGTIDLPALLLYLGSIFWTLAYDTIYAHQDKEDDAKIGVKSTAIHLGSKTKTALRIFYAASFFFWCLAGYSVGKSWLMLLILAFAYGLKQWEVSKLDINNPTSCRKAFLTNSWFGAIIFASFLIVS